MPYIHKEYERLDCAASAFSSDAGLIERAARYSVFAIGGRVEEEEEEEEERECSVVPGESEAKVKSEPTDASENPNSMSERTACKVEKQMKRKEREKKIVLEMIELRELDTARAILRQTQAIGVMKQEEPERYLKLEHLLVWTYFDPLEATLDKCFNVDNVFYTRCGLHHQCLKVQRSLMKARCLLP